MQSRLKPLLHFVRYRLGPGIVLLLMTAHLHADYQSGLDAYTQGHYKRAMQEWKEVAAQPPGAVNPAIYAETHYAIARLYWDGQGVGRDYYQAREWLEKATALGHAGAMAKLGYLYTDGISVEQDFDQAFEWYGEAARLGNVDGQYNLGIFYLNGWGTEKDPTMAKQYLAAASAQGDQAAEQALQQLLSSGAPPVGAASDAITQPPKEQEPQQKQSAASDLPQQNELVGEATAATNVGGAPAATNHGKNQSRLTPLLQGEPWILAQDPNHYTIQVIGLSSRDNLESLVEGHENLTPLATYTVQKTTRPIYLLIQGVYPGVEDARAARDAFPQAISPPKDIWIRQFQKIQEIINREVEPQ